MLGIVSANGSRLNAGSVGLSVAQRWSEAGQRVLFIDIDTAQPPLAERYGSAVRAEYSPEKRGLPSLIAAREPLNLKLLANHCYSLDADEGSRWALFAPSHPAGAGYAAQWLAKHFGELMEIDRERSVIVAASLKAGDTAPINLLRAMPVLAFLAPASTEAEAEALRHLCESSWLTDEDRGTATQKRILIIEGEAEGGAEGLGDNQVMGISRLFVEGRLPFVEDEKLLRMQPSRKDREFIREFDKITERLMRVSGLGADRESETAPEEEVYSADPAASAETRSGAAITEDSSNDNQEAQHHHLNPVASELEGGGR